MKPVEHMHERTEKFPIDNRDARWITLFVYPEVVFRQPR